MTLTSRVSGYGLHVVTAELGGERFQGAGLSETEASYKARVQALGCGCGRMVLEGEAAVSRRAYGRVVCGRCREALAGPRLEEMER